MYRVRSVRPQAVGRTSETAGRETSGHLPPTSCAFCKARSAKKRTSWSESFLNASSTGSTFCWIIWRPSAEPPNVVAKTSRALATLKRMLGIGSLARCNRLSRISARTMSRVKDGAMTYRRGRARHRTSD